MSTVSVVRMRDGGAELHDPYLGTAEADGYLAELEDGIAWRQERIRVYGREVLTPRLTAWYGDPHAVYSWSGLTQRPRPWTRALTRLRRRIEDTAGVPLNAVLLNCYRDGRDSVSWHSDDERVLGPHPFIATLSLGATRRFQLAHRSADVARIDLDLTHGSLLLMRPPTQRHWKHRVPKQMRIRSPRINLTFRYIAPDAPGLRS